MKKIFFTFILVLLIPNLNKGWSAVKSVKEIKNQITQKGNAVTSLMAKIRSLEKKLGTTNDNYLAKTDSIKEVEAQLEKSRHDMETTNQAIEVKKKNTHQLINSYTLNQIDEEDAQFMLRRRYIIDIMQAELKELKAIKKTNNDKIAQLQSLSQRLVQLKKDEESLYRLIVDMENNKKDLSKEYVNRLEEKNELEEKLEEEVSKRKVYKRRVVAKDSHGAIPNSFKMTLPLRGFESYKPGRKGISFKYQNSSDLYAVASGKVVYTGELSSYGKVIMIDHGSDIRSVLLGDISIDVKKDSLVSAGQRIGHTKADIGISKTLYFEMRKKNIAQDTAFVLKNNKLI